MTDLISLPPRYIDEGIFGKCVLRFWQPTGTTARTALLIAGAVSFGVFHLASKSLGIPALPRFDGSLLHQPMALLAFISVAIILLINAIVGTILAGAVRFEAGLFASVIGMLAISERSGTMQSVIFENGPSASLFIGLAAELLILSAMIAGVWLLLWKIGSMGFVHNLYPEEAIVEREPKNETNWMQGLTASAAQIIATAAIMMFLCRADAKNQAVASVGIASLAGAFIAHKYSPCRPSYWFWSGPLIVGIVGYLIAAFTHDPQLAIGAGDSTFAPLARPLPIDYASIGTACAILGYWIARPEPPVDV